MGTGTPGLPEEPRSPGESGASPELGPPEPTRAERPRLLGEPQLPDGLGLGAAIAYLRRRAGMSQHELTRKLGLSARSNLSDYERGRRVPPADIVLACEEIFGLVPVSPAGDATRA